MAVAVLAVDRRGATASFLGLPKLAQASSRHLDQ
jgi:hypothetical protein